MKKTVISCKWRVQSRARQQAVARLIIIAVIATAPLLSRLGYGQSPALTTVKDTVYMGAAAPGSGNPVASGTVVISWQPLLDAANKPIFGGTRTYTLTNGALAVSLVPNAAGTPAGTAYTVRYYQSGVAFREEFWVVPASSPIASPAAPVVTQAGTPGTTTYYYWVLARNATGETLIGPSGVTTTSNATLSGTNYNIADVADVSGATGYRWFRTTTATAPVVGSCNCQVTGSPTAVSVINDQTNTLIAGTIPTVNDTDPKTLAQVRVALPPSPTAAFAASQVTGTGIVANPTATQTITAPITSGIPLQVKGRSGNSSNVAEWYDNQGTPELQAWLAAGGDWCAQDFGNIKIAACFTGATAGAKMIAAIADLPSAGGIVDARGLEGAQIISADMFSGVTKPVNLLLGHATFTLSVTQNIPNNVAIEGQGKGSTILNWTGSTSGTALNIGTSATRSSVRHLQLTTGQAGTTKAVNVAQGVDILLDDLLITGASGTTGFNLAINITGNGAAATSNNVSVLNSRIENYTGTGIGVDHAIQTHLVNLELNSNLSNILYNGLLLDTGVSGLFLEGVSIGYGLHGLVIQDTDRGGTGEAPIHLFFSKFLSDTTSGGDGILFGATLATSYVNAHFTDVWAAGAGRNNVNAQVTAGAVGIKISGGRQIFFVGGRIRSNDADAIKIDDADVRDVWIEGMNITENNQANGADAHGVYVTAAATNLSFLNNNVSNLPSGNMKYGVKTSAVNADELAIIGNDFTALVTGGISNSSTGDFVEAFNKPNAEIRTTGSGAWNIGFDFAGTSTLYKQFRTAHAAGNVPSQLNVGVADGGFGGMQVKDIRNGANTFNDQSVEIHTAEGGVSAGVRLTIDKAGNVKVGSGTAATKLDLDGAFRSTLTTVTFSATPTFDASLGNSFKMTLTANVTSSTISSAQTGEFITLLLCQDATGSRTMAWPANLKLAGGTYTLTTTINKCDSVTALYDGANWYETGRAANL